MSKVPDKSDAVCGNDGITYSNQVRIFGLMSFKLGLSVKLSDLTSTLDYR